ncbi:hypothetical protein GCM10009574_033740 [Streptomyces asiaticus]
MIQTIMTNELDALRARLLTVLPLADESTREAVSGVLKSWLVFVQTLCVDWLTHETCTRAQLRDVCIGAAIGALRPLFAEDPHPTGRHNSPARPPRESPTDLAAVTGLFPFPTPDDMRLRRVGGSAVWGPRRVGPRRMGAPPRGAPPQAPGSRGGSPVRGLGQSPSFGVWGGAPVRAPGSRGRAPVRGLGRSPSFGKGRGGERPPDTAQAVSAPSGAAGGTPPPAPTRRPRG